MEVTSFRPVGEPALVGALAVGAGAWMPGGGVSDLVVLAGQLAVVALWEVAARRADRGSGAGSGQPVTPRMRDMPGCDRRPEPTGTGVGRA